MSVKCILTEQGGKGGGGGSNITVESISIQTPPSKTSYYAGDAFDKSGMVVIASYALDGMPFSKADVTNNVAVSPTTLTDGITAVTISYTDGSGITVKTTQAVQVTHRLQAIEVTNRPSIVDYEYGDTLATAGMVVKAIYSDGAKVQVTPNSVSPTVLNTVGTQSITVTYKDASVATAVSTTFTVNVERKTVAVPTWKGSLTYNGTAQSVTSASFWNNYDSTLMAIGGETFGTNAGSYDATFTPKSNYRWPDKTTAAKTVVWSIAKKTYTLGLSTQTVTINASNYATGVQVSVTKEGTGAVSASVNKAGVTATVNGTNITIKGNGSTAGTFEVTVSVAADNNHNAPSAKKITVTAEYFVLPFTDGATGDASWWSGLKNALANSTATQRQQCVGRKVRVTLSSAVLGTTTHYVRCIGYDCDGAKTLTFETMNCLAEYTAFGSNAIWFDGTTDSTARAKCKEYYNAFPGKNAIRSVKKRYCSVSNGSSGQAADKTYTETCFLVSYAERGYTNTSYSSSMLEFAEENTNNTPYQYFTGDDRRGKYKGTDNDPQGKTSNLDGYPWTRSRCYDSASYVCIVDDYGNATYNYYHGSNGLAPAFAVG